MAGCLTIGWWLLGTAISWRRGEGRGQGQGRQDDSEPWEERHLFQAVAVKGHIRLGLQRAWSDLNSGKLPRDPNRNTLAPQRPVKWEGDTRQPHSGDRL